MAGKPVYSIDIDTVSFDWGNERPYGISTQVFSAQFNGNVLLDGGRYEFTASAAGEVQVYVNGNLIANGVNTQGGNYRGEADVLRGINSIQVNYINYGNAAQVQLNYRQISPATSPNKTATPSKTIVMGTVFPTPEPSTEPAPTKAWKVEYFNNPNVTGKPVVTTQASRVYFMWGQAAPARTVNRDGFSARFTKNERFAQGKYRFTTRSDDGVRVYIDDELVINEWRAQPFGKNYIADVTLSAGVHTIRVEYFDQGGAAALQFSWVKLK